MNETRTCKYDGCREPVNSSLDDEYCVFHAPVEKKGISVEEFNKKIFERIHDIIEYNKKAKNDRDKKEFDFRGFIFPGDIDFHSYEEYYGNNLIFNCNVDFSYAKFAGKTLFWKTQFPGISLFRNTNFLTDIFFREVIFSKDTKFNNSIFGGEAFFWKTTFQGATSYWDAQFLKDIDFNDSRFLRDASFWKTKFMGNADFKAARFSSSANFSNARFIGDLDLSDSLFEGDTYFNNTFYNNRVSCCRLKIQRSMKFVNITFSLKASFYLKNPIFQPKENVNPKVIFDAIQFNPFAVYFGNIKAENNYTDAFMIFRYCQLKDTYFTNNDMSLFSFYKSSFDEARFMSSYWSEPEKPNDRILCFSFKRQNIIPEENFLKQIAELKEDEEATKELKENYKIEDLKSHLDIASLYRQMKTALDNTKDYEQSGWFYFNELEMKRCALEEEIENNNSWLIGNFKKIFSKYILYFCYKVFTGYGHKPMWSFGWFLFFLLLVFTPLNYLLGVKPVVDGKELSSTLWDAFVFSLYRILPTNYVPFAREFVVPDTVLGLVVPFFNTLILIVLIAFIGIGLKRHFRRF